jgi:KUP system potassium uptake protein
VSGSTAFGSTPPDESEKAAPPRHGGRPSALLLAALGIVFGDIGTSPLYALQTVFSIDHNDVRPT